MKITVSQPKQAEVTITIEAEEADLAKFLDKAIVELGQQVTIKGFRKGKIPKEALEKHLGAGAIRVHALDLALPHLYAEAVLQENVPVVARPEIKFIGDNPFVFEAIVAVLPEVKISGYEKIKIKKKDVAVTDKEVDDLIDYLRKQRAEYKEVDRAAKMGDRVEMDFDGFDPKGDVPLEGTASKNHPAVLGEGTLIPGFEEEIIGLKAGAEKTFDITFPKDYHSKKFQGKKVKFKIKIHKVEEVNMPEVTSEWIKEASGQDRTPEEFRKDVRENLEKERIQQEKQRRESEFLDELLKLATLEVPKALIEEEIDFMLDRTKMDLQGRGLQWEQYEEYMKTQNRDLRAEKKEQAEKQVKLRVILQHIYKEEKIDPTDAEVEKHLEGLLGSYPKDQQAKLKENYKKGSEGHIQIQNALRIEKFFQKFLS
jgi:trigger factor